MRGVFLGIPFFILAFNVAAEFSENTRENNVPEKLRLCWHEAHPYGAPGLIDGGLETDFVRTVMIEAGFQPDMIFVPWARCKNGVTTGQYDMLFAMWNDVDLHQQEFDFFNVTEIQHTSFIVLKDSPLKTSKLDTLYNVRIALLVDGGYDSKILNHKGFVFFYVNDDIQKIKMLVAERVDLIIGDPLRFEAQLKNDFKNQDIQLRTLLPHIQVQRTSPAISKKNPYKKEIIRRYNAAYSRLCDNGVLQEIIHKHGFDYYPIDCPR